MQHLVIDRPEAVEVEHLLVPRSGSLHLSIGLVADAVVDEQEGAEQVEQDKKVYSNPLDQGYTNPLDRFDIFGVIHVLQRT